MKAKLAAGLAALIGILILFLPIFPSTEQYDEVERYERDAKFQVVSVSRSELPEECFVRWTVTIDVAIRNEDKEGGRFEVINQIRTAVGPLDPQATSKFLDAGEVGHLITIHTLPCELYGRDALVQPEYKVRPPQITDTKVATKTRSVRRPLLGFLTAWLAPVTSPTQIPATQAPPTQAPKQQPSSLTRPPPPEPAPEPVVGPPVNVIGNVKGSFSLQVERLGGVVGRAYSDSIWVTVTPTPDFDSEVSLSVEGLPEGVLVKFDPDRVSLGRLSAIMKFEVGNDAKTGKYELFVGARTGSLVNTQRYVLEIVDHLLLIDGFRFPDTYTVKAGTTVTWLNKDRPGGFDFGAHTVTAANGQFDSHLLYTGQTWSSTFAQSGTYEYNCKVHSYMKGEIVVVP